MQMMLWDFWKRLRCPLRHLTHMREVGFLSPNIFGMWTLSILIDQTLICVITYLTHKSYIPSLFSFVHPTKLLVRPLSCFCAPCVDQYWEKCEVTSHIPLWWPIKLQSKDTNFVCG
jgi:hypothetical protein